METLGNKKNPKNIDQIYNCETCNFHTSHFGDWKKHLSTAKHMRRSNEGKNPIICDCGKVFSRQDNLNRHKKQCNISEKNNKKPGKLQKCFQMFPATEKSNKCECGKVYKTRSGLWKHQKQCIYANQNDDKSTENITGVGSSKVLEMFGSLNAKLEQTCEDNQILKEDNKMLKEKLIQLESGVMTAVSEPKTINNYNNNIIFLLNEKCSDAVAIKDFANQIAMCLEDVDYAMENGKVKGIENIIRKKFEELGTFKRPLHCTDVKRGTLYVKNEEGWEKEKGEINKMIRDVECVQTSGITVWSEANPDYSLGNSRLMDKWLRIVQCLTGSIEGVGMRKIEKRCQEMCKIDQNVIV